MNMPQGWELILVLLVVVLVFGAKRLPDSARALGRSMRILKAETKGLHDDDRPTTTTASVTAPVTPTPVQPVQPVAAPDVQPFAGQQLYDAQGRPVQAPVNGSAHNGSAQNGSEQVRPAQQASPQA